MAQLGDFLARLFSGGGSRGLSGDADQVLRDEPDAGYFGDLLRRFKTEEDLVANPGLLWTGSSLLSRKQGLEVQLLAARGDGVAGFTDMLVIVNSADWQRGHADPRAPWKARAAEAVVDHFNRFCIEQDFHLIYPQRGAQVAIIEDGGPEMGGTSLELGQGEFVTGLLPNTYSGPVQASRAVIAVLLNIPGFWEGYQEVGRLYSDQILFTLGNHWLDSFDHIALEKPALYRLQRYADGSFVHIINPEFQDAFRITSFEDDGGPAVLTIESMEGQPIAHMVLAIVGEAVETAPAAGPIGRPGIDLPVPTADGEIIAPPINPLMGSRTVVPADVEERILTLAERGALLQKVHFSKFMTGYDVFLGAGGELGTDLARPAAVFQVRGNEVFLEARLAGVQVGGRPTKVGQPVPMRGDTEVTVGGQRIRYNDLRGVDVEGWPYLGEIRRNGATSYMVFGNAFKIGRDRRSKVRLPDEPHNENIVWLEGMTDGSSIRSRTGEIPKSRFYTDSIMVASEHAEIDLRKEPALFSLARHCYTYVRRRKDIFALVPTNGKPGPTNIDLLPGDEILIGNCVFSVGYPPADGPRMSPSDTGLDIPRPPLDARELAKAANTNEDATAKSAPAIARGPVTGTEVAAAAGFGERGPAPPRPQITIDALDSLLGIDLPEPKALQQPLSTPKMAPPMMVNTTMEYELADLPASALLAASKAPASIGAEGRSVAQLGAEGRAPPPVALPPTAAPSRAATTMPPPLGGSPAAPTPVVASEDVGAPVGRREDVLIVDEADWQLELARPARLVLEGWMVSGEQVVGNHRGGPIGIPENRSEPGQTFTPTDYFALFVRGRRARAQLLAPGEARILADGRPVTEVLNAHDARFIVVRRDSEGQDDFEVELRLAATAVLPDPRARLLCVHEPDRMVQALFTTGLPLRAPRDVLLGPLAATAAYDGQTVTLRDYLSSYRRANGEFSPLFVRSGEGSFRTVPEDGSPLVLQPGDQLLSGTSLYTFRR